MCSGSPAQCIREVLRKGISLCNMPGASRALARHCAPAKTGDRNKPSLLNPFLLFHLKGQYSAVSGIVQWKNAAEQCVLNPHILSSTHHTDKCLNKTVAMQPKNTGRAPAVSSHDDSYGFIGPDSGIISNCDFCHRDKAGAVFCLSTSKVIPGQIKPR